MLTRTDIVPLQVDRPRPTSNARAVPLATCGGVLLNGSLSKMTFNDGIRAAQRSRTVRPSMATPTRPVQEEMTERNDVWNSLSQSFINKALFLLFLVLSRPYRMRDRNLRVRPVSDPIQLPVVDRLNSR